jgi:hypothetical protein
MIIDGVFYRCCVDNFIVSLVHISSNELIYQYIQEQCSWPFNKFIFIDYSEWWIGGENNQSKILFNCEQRVGYNVLDNIRWQKVMVSPSFNYLFIFRADREWILYDIYNFPQINTVGVRWFCYGETYYLIEPELVEYRFDILKDNSEIIDGFYNNEKIVRLLF